jgi:hypothetical protein
VGIHSVTGTERNWDWFKRLAGGTFVRHAKFQKFKQLIVDSTHPSTNFLPRNWENEDECYYIKTINPDLHVLLAHDLNSVTDEDKPVIYGNTFPSAWCHQFDGGRQWYTSLGHDDKMYSDELFLKHIMGGIEWTVNGNQPLDYSKARATSPNDPLPYLIKSYEKSKQKKFFNADRKGLSGCNSPEQRADDCSCKCIREKCPQQQDQRRRDWTRAHFAHTRYAGSMEIR